MDELKERIDQLKVAEGADCPLCGQPLSAVRTPSLIERLDRPGQRDGRPLPRQPGCC